MIYDIGAGDVSISLRFDERVDRYQHTYAPGEAGGRETIPYSILRLGHITLAPEGPEALRALIRLCESALVEQAVIALFDGIRTAVASGNPRITEPGCACPPGAEIGLYPCPLHTGEEVEAAS